MVDAVTATRHGSTVLLTMNRSENRNALAGELIDGLVENLVAANADDTVRCVVVTGEKRSFCSGGNLPEMLELNERKPSLEEMKKWYQTGVHRLPRTLRSMDNVVTIAAVNGFAVGAGCDFAAMFDLRIAGESTIFHESYLRLGIIPGAGGIWLLSHLIGHARAREMLYSAEPVNAQKALDWGLVSRVSPDAKLVEDALAWAEQIGSMPREATRQGKRLFKNVDRVSFDDHLEQAVNVQVQLQLLEDHREALLALMDGRKAHFKGSIL
jgi:enoyl-CoA hydratase/carnithine racemase